MVSGDVKSACNMLEVVAAKVAKEQQTLQKTEQYLSRSKHTGKVGSCEQVAI